MLDAHLPDVIEHNSLLQGKFPHEFALLGGGDILIRHKMVGDHDNFLGVEDLFHADFTELLNRNWRGDVITEN